MSHSILSRLIERVARLGPFKISHEEKHSLDPPFPGFHWLTTFLTLFMFGILIPLNYALQGYQVETSYKLDYNTTSPHWFNHFYPRPKDGTQCDPHIFTIGDTFTTTAGIFQWSVAGGKARQAASGRKKMDQKTWNLTYSGQTLDWCDISEMQISVNSDVQSGQLSWMMECYSDEFYFVANAELDIGDPDDGSFREGSRDSNFLWAEQYIADAGWDLIYQMQNISLNHMVSDAPTQLFFASLWLAQCPAILHGDNNQAAADAYANLTYEWEGSWCDPADLTSQTNPPSLNLDWSTLATTPTVDLNSYRQLISNAVNNVFQAMLAIGRADIGNILPSNFLNNTITVFDQDPPVFLPPFTGVDNVSTQGLFYSDNMATNWENGWLAKQNYSSLHQLVVPYLCRLTVPKPVGSAFVSVFAATVTMGATAWKIYTWLVNLIVKLNGQADSTLADRTGDEESAMERRRLAPGRYSEIFPARETDSAIPLQERGVRSDESHSTATVADYDNPNDDDMVKM